MSVAPVTSLSNCWKPASLILAMSAWLAACTWTCGVECQEPTAPAVGGEQATPAVQDETSPEKAPGPTPESGEKPVDPAPEPATESGGDTQPAAETSSPPDPASADIGELNRLIRRMGRNRQRSRMGESMISLVQPLAEAVSIHTARIWSGKDSLALGTVVDASGLILTAASELKEPLEVQLADGRRIAGKVIGIDIETDLALLQVEASGLPALALTDIAPPDRGAWLVSVSPDASPVGFGVVGVPARSIPPSRAFIGIRMDETTDNSGVRITEVTSGSPADAADLLVNDVITHLDDKPVTDSASLRMMLAEHEPGDRVVLKIRRGEASMEASIELANADNFLPDFERSNQQDRMGSSLSERRYDFPLAFQHDSVLSAHQIGGPVLDLEGHVVGVNISRQGRVSSLALPMSVVLASLERLKKGDLSPAVVNQGRIAELDARMQTVTAQLEPLASKLTEAQSTLAAEKARREELERLHKDLDARMQSISEQTAALEKTIADTNAEIARLKVQQQRIERDRKRLQSGIGGQ